MNGQCLVDNAPGLCGNESFGIGFNKMEIDLD